MVVVPVAVMGEKERKRGEKYCINYSNVTKINVTQGERSAHSAGFPVNEPSLQPDRLIHETQLATGCTSGTQEVSGSPCRKHLLLPSQNQNTGVDINRYLSWLIQWIQNPARKPIHRSCCR